MAVDYEWTGDDFALGELPNLLGVQSFQTFAPDHSDWGVARIEIVPTVRCTVERVATAPKYWWVSAEVEFDASYSEDGALITPDITSGDQRLLWVAQLTPRVTLEYTGVVGTTWQHIVWEPGSMKPAVQTRRQGSPGAGFQAAVCWNFRANDQHGVFAVPAGIGVNAFATNLSARVLWYRVL